MATIFFVIAVVVLEKLRCFEFYNVLQIENISLLCTYFEIVGCTQMIIK